LSAPPANLFLSTLASAVPYRLPPAEATPLAGNAISNAASAPPSLAGALSSGTTPGSAVPPAVVPAFFEPDTLRSYAFAWQWAAHALSSSSTQWRDWHDRHGTLEPPYVMGCPPLPIREPASHQLARGVIPPPPKAWPALSACEPLSAVGPSRPPSPRLRRRRRHPTPLRLRLRLGDGALESAMSRLSHRRYPPSRISPLRLQRPRRRRHLLPTQLRLYLDGGALETAIPRPCRRHPTQLPRRRNGNGGGIRRALAFPSKATTRTT